MIPQVYMTALEHEEKYKLAHPRIWERDLRIARLLQQGKGATEISQEIICAKASVYRAVERLRRFYQIETLRQEVADDPPNYGEDADCVLEMLFNAYEENNNFDNDAVKEGFRQLYQQMEGEKLEQIDPVIYTASILCRDHEKAGFTAGVKIGVQLGRELRD